MYISYKCYYCGSKLKLKKFGREIENIRHLKKDNSNQVY